MGCPLPNVVVACLWSSGRGSAAGDAPARLELKTQLLSGIMETLISGQGDELLFRALVAGEAMPTFLIPNCLLLLSKFRMRQK